VRVQVGPARISPVHIGPARIKPAKERVRVQVGPAKIAPVHIGPAKLKPVQVVVKDSHHDTAAAVVSAAARPGVPPIPNAEAARKVAQPVADHVRNNRKKYDHKRVATFQALAGITADGLYGPITAKALRAHGAKQVVG
jgi:murein L,D-transpeptidase YcbB/YkuD